jgi:hypothetical protein
MADSLADPAHVLGVTSRALWKQNQNFVSIESLAAGFKQNFSVGPTGAVEWYDADNALREPLAKAI